MKFSFKPSEYSTKHFFNDQNRSHAAAAEEKKWNRYAAAVDVYRADKERFLDHAGSLGKLSEARSMLKKMEADPANPDTAGFLEDFPKWPESGQVERYQRIPLMDLENYKNDFAHIGMPTWMLPHLDDSISFSNASLELVKDSKVKNLFKPRQVAASAERWVYEVPRQDEIHGENRAVLALVMMAVHEFNRRTDENQIYMHAKARLDPDNHRRLEYLFVYPEDNAERHIWRKVFLGIPRPQGSLLPPPFVADIPKPPPYAAAPVMPSEKVKQLLVAKNMLRLAGADEATLAAVTDQIARLAVGSTGRSQQDQRPRSKALDQNFV